MLQLLVLACTITYVTAACRRCLPMNENQKFCQADFAGVFKIMDNGTVIGVDRVYEVKLRTLYRKTTITKNNPGPWKLFTPADSRACGTTFVSNAYYVVSGYYKEIPGQLAQMTTTKCSFKQYFDIDPVPSYLPPTCVTTESEGRGL
ncbi:uncharacterized protein LOC123535616 [Mercenaria mercenaria]|uniref:uncharacterized protein LOC123535616 n=1 Tax=Mercenaria mercenaria TaxID=6596 RepID=UPI00234E530E|nr:uncharacterized protein LOC123535616 [Mercenaria mercenaria]